MTDQEKDKLIVESLGECWHEWEYDSHYNYPKAMLCVCGSKHYKLPIPPLATPEGFFWWWERAQKMEWWGQVMDWAYNRWLDTVNPGLTSDQQFFLWLIHPTRGRDTAYEFFVAHPE